MTPPPLRNFSENSYVLVGLGFPKEPLGTLPINNRQTEISEKSEINLASEHENIYAICSTLFNLILLQIHMENCTLA